MNPSKPRVSIYTKEDILQMLKDRQGGLMQKQYAAEIGISAQLLSDIYRGHREAHNCEAVMIYLAPKGKHFERYAYVLVPGPPV